MRRRGCAWSWLLASVLLICLVLSAKADATNRDSLAKSSHHQPTANSSQTHDGHGSQITGIPIVTFKWHHVQAPYLVALWVLVSFLGKIGT